MWKPPNKKEYTCLGADNENLRGIATVRQLMLKSDKEKETWVGASDLESTF